MSTLNEFMKNMKWAMVFAPKDCLCALSFAATHTKTNSHGGFVRNKCLKKLKNGRIDLAIYVYANVFSVALCVINI